MTVVSGRYLSAFAFAWDSFAFRSDFDVLSAVDWSIWVATSCVSSLRACFEPIVSTVRSAINLSWIVSSIATTPPLWDSSPDASGAEVIKPPSGSQRNAAIATLTSFEIRLKPCKADTRTRDDNCLRPYDSTLARVIGLLRASTDSE